MWIYALGETLKRATLTSHAATSRISGDLCKVLADMTKPQTGTRASLMYLLDVSTLNYVLMIAKPFFNFDICNYTPPIIDFRN